jgi:hypothetical protein
MEVKYNLQLQLQWLIVEKPVMPTKPVDVFQCQKVKKMTINQK